MKCGVLRIRANELLAELNHQEKLVKEEKEKCEIAEDSVRDCSEALQLVQAVAEEIQNRVHEKIAGVVTQCLRSVFQDGSEFKISFAKARNKTEANLSFWKDGFEESPMDASSGGKLEIASFALRLACISLSRPQKRKLLVLDEPMRFVHGAENRERAKALIETMAKKMGFQFIFCTGLNWLKCGKIVDLEGDS